jgi:hypothetical protein
MLEKRGTQARKSSLERIDVKGGKPIFVRIERPPRTRIRVGGKPLLRDVITLQAPTDQDPLRGLDIQVIGAPTAGRAAKSAAPVKVDVRSGLSQVLLNLPSGATSRLRFVKEASAKLAFCPVLDDLVVLGANGICPYCHANHPV